MICVSLGNTEFPDLTDILTREKRVEVRLDLNGYTDDELREICSSPAEVVAACRPGKFPEEERIRKLKLCADAGARYIDVELETGEERLRGTAAEIKSRGAKLIISHHNFDLTPAAEELESIYGTCADKGADIIKIACRSTSQEDNARLLSLYRLTESRGYPPLIAIGLGGPGRVTRAAIPFLGAPFTYVSLEKGRETADGQFTKSLLENIFQLIANG